MKENIKTFLKKNGVVFLFLFFTIAVLMLYWIKVGNFPKFSLSSDAEDWADFGTFFAGSIGTIGAIFAAIYAIMTFGSQSKVNNKVLIDREKSIILEAIKLNSTHNDSEPNWLITDEEDLEFKDKNIDLYTQKCKDGFDYFAKKSIFIKVLSTQIAKIKKLEPDNIFFNFILQEHILLEIKHLQNFTKFLKKNNKILTERNTPEIKDITFHDMTAGFKKIDEKFNVNESSYSIYCKYFKQDN